MSSRTVLIAGGGIGGLATALATAKAGFRALVLERTDPFSEFGAGLQISPNASRILQSFGCEPDLEKLAGTPDSVRMFSARSGQQLSVMPLGDAAVQRWGAPYWTLHRADLHHALLEACKANPDIEIRNGVSIDTYADHPDGVILSTRKDGVAAQETGMILVGADGVRSQIRKTLIGDGLPQFTGLSALRATIPIEDAPAALRGNFTGLWLGSGVHVVHYALRRASVINIVIIVEDNWQEEGWSVPVERAFALVKVAGCDQTLRDLIAAPREWTRWAMFGRKPDAGWPQGRVTLLGDAAHPMLPFLAQGAGMALEDAATLATCLKLHPADPTAALGQYQKQRLPRTGRVQTGARTNGRIFHMKQPFAMGRDIVMRAMGESGLMSRMDWLYGFKAPLP